MGSTGGHLVPGLFFFIYGCTWCLFSFWLHLTAQSKTNNQVKTKSKTRHSRLQSSSSLSYENFKREMELSRKSYIPQPFCKNIPMEPIIKMMCSLLGIFVEVFLDMKDGKIVASVLSLSHDSNGNFANIGKLQHITMYFGFFVSGMIDLVTLFIRVPRGTTKLFLTLAFINEGLLFYFHKDSTSDIFQYTIHLLLFIAIFVCGIFSALRIKTPLNLLINSGLAFGLLLQSTWFFQISMIFHREDHWNFNDHSNQMFVVALYAWHISVIATVMLLTLIILTACFKSSICYRAKSRRQWLPPIPLLPMTAPHDSEEEEQLIQPDNAPAPPQLIETVMM